MDKEVMAAVAGAVERHEEQLNSITKEWFSAIERLVVIEEGLKRISADYDKGQSKDAENIDSIKIAVAVLRGKIEDLGKLGPVLAQIAKQMSEGNTSCALARNNFENDIKSIQEDVARLSDTVSTLVNESSTAKQRKDITKNISKRTWALLTGILVAITAITAFLVDVKDLFTN